MRSVRALLVAACAIGGAAGHAGAQRHADLDRADSLFTAGRIPEAEAIYYAAVRSRPRDPLARLALGRYLASRGALRVGAVLMEEARFFGANAAAVAAELAPVYGALNDYRALAALAGAPLSTAERRRAEWLAANPPTVTLEDTARVPLRPGEGLGSIRVVVGPDTLEAIIDPGITGIVLDTAFARRRDARLFGAAGDARRASGVSLALRIGTATLARVPTRYTAQSRGRARISLDLLRPLAPTFDEREGQLILYPPRVRTRHEGELLRTVSRAGAVFLVLDGLVPLDGPAARGRLGGARWTWVGRSGEVRVR